MSLPTRFKLTNISYNELSPDIFESFLHYETIDGDADEQFDIRILAVRKVIDGPHELRFTFERQRRFEPLSFSFKKGF